MFLSFSVNQTSEILRSLNYLVFALSSLLPPSLFFSLPPSLIVICHLIQLVAKQCDVLFYLLVAKQVNAA